MGVDYRLGGNSAIVSQAKNLPPTSTADSFHGAKLAAFRGQRPLWGSKNFQQFAQSHRADGRQHVQRDTSLSGSHFRQGATPRRPPVPTGSIFPSRTPPRTVLPFALSM